MLVPDVLEKMPGEMCSQLARENSTSNLKIEDLCRISILEHVTTHSDTGIDDYGATASFSHRSETTSREPDSEF